MFWKKSGLGGGGGKSCSRENHLTVNVLIAHVLWCNMREVSLYEQAYFEWWWEVLHREGHQSEQAWPKWWWARPTANHVINPKATMAFGKCVHNSDRAVVSGQ